ncbi:hypothetical protein RBB79_05125 [Tunturiibacter empetritectus]|uniref:Uncharacterized protein n=1 Tax=Tunturiibacter lichenicola TaxID=2051959 RepID=A0A852VB30_9BACT|nr:hypothetical protein [Edaphobacter lichenicola]NYF88900.1 hypothetical protein [Edaphobacter lichenicola]
MADPNHADSIAQIHSSEREIDALENKINEADESTTEPKYYAAMRREQEQHRQQILKSKSEIDQKKYAE